MKTKLFLVDADSPAEQSIKEVAEIIRHGGVAAIPTETVFGLGCDAGNKEAVKKLYTIKKRPAGKPFTIQIATFDQLADYLDKLPPGVEKFLKEFWPGPLTALLKGKDGKIGLRMPDNKTTLSIIKEAKVSLAVTSANISGDRDVSSAKDAFKVFDGSIEAVVDDGIIAKGIASTVVDCTTLPYKILREGTIADKIKKYLEDNGCD
ncbi:MAG: threonylcarbamoyl-AMP synthase [Candidatus Omnitrophica bacterium]|nr:threonylcarbamoyl-AMP synthase [Candidatus Omnitrophota bacterium]